MRLIFLNNNYVAVDAIGIGGCLIHNNAGSFVNNNSLAVANVDSCFLNVRHCYSRIADYNRTVLNSDTTADHILHGNSRIYDNESGTVEAVLHLCVYTVSVTADVNNRINNGGFCVSYYAANIVKLHSSILDIENSGSVISLEYAACGAEVTVKIPFTTVNVDLAVSADIEDTVCGRIILTDKINVYKIKSSIRLCKYEYCMLSYYNTADVNGTVLNGKSGILADLVIACCNSKGLTVEIDSKIVVNIESILKSHVNAKLNSVSAYSRCKSILKAEVVCIADISNNVTTCNEVGTIGISIAVDYINLDALGNRSRKLFAPVVSICTNGNTAVICYGNSDVSYATLGGYCILFHGKRSLGCATANDDSRIALCSVGMNSVVCKSNNRSRAVAATLTDTNGIAAYGNGRVVDYNVRGILNVKTVLRLNGTTVDLDTGYVYNLKKAVHGIVNSTVNDSKILIATGVRLDSSDCTVATGEGTTLKGYVGNVTGSIRATEVNASCLGNISCIEVYISDSKATVSKGCALAVNGNSTVKGVIVTINNEVEI